MMYRLASQLVNKLHAALRVPALTGHHIQACAFTDSPTGEGEGLAADLTVGERKIINKLRQELPSATYIQVEDVSGVFRNVTMALNMKKERLMENQCPMPGLELSQKYITEKSVSTVVNVEKNLQRPHQFLHTALRVPALTGHHIQACAFTDSPTGEGEGLAADLTVGERKIINKLRQEFPSATYIQVEDVSGGCGAMYQISIESPEFAGKRTVQQHRMVNKALEEEIRDLHGFQLQTKAPTEEEGI